MDATITEDAPARDVTIVVVSRKGQNLRQAQKQNTITASSEGFGHISPTSPPLNTLSQSTVLGNTGEGVGLVRHQRIFYSWPGVQMLVPEAVGIEIATADGSTTLDGVLDVPFDEFLASLCSNLAPERNPGELSDTTQAILLRKS